MPDFDGSLLFVFLVALIIALLNLFSIQDEKKRRIAGFVTAGLLVALLASAIFMAYHFNWHSDILGIPATNSYASETPNINEAPTATTAPETAKAPYSVVTASPWQPSQPSTQEPSGNSSYSSTVIWSLASIALTFIITAITMFSSRSSRSSYQTRVAWILLAISAIMVVLILIKL